MEIQENREMLRILFNPIAPEKKRVINKLKEVGGTYFLYHNSRILYIGSSNNTKRRMAEHLSSAYWDERRKWYQGLGMSHIHFPAKEDEYPAYHDFILNTINYIEVRYTSDYRKYERELIKKHKPPFNKHYNEDYSRQADIRNIVRAFDYASVMEDTEEFWGKTAERMDSILKGEYYELVELNKRRKLRMNEKLTNKEIQEIKRRAAYATEGPWWESEGVYVVASVTGDSLEWGADFVAEVEREEDAKFIAHAREDIPKLLAEIERMKDVLDEAFSEGKWGRVIANIEEWRMRGNQGRVIDIIEEWRMSND